MIHEFKSKVAVHTPHGEGDAILLIDYGLDVNSVCVVRLRGGNVRHHYSTDLRIYGNPMDGNGWDIEIPEEWKK